MAGTLSVCLPTKPVLSPYQYILTSLSGESYLRCVQPHVPPQHTQVINKNCPEGEEMEVGGVCRCKANSGSLEAESPESRGQGGPPNSDMDVPWIRERQMLSGSTYNMSKPGIL